jgi:beta-glucanase (GH16 family)
MKYLLLSLSITFLGLFVACNNDDSNPVGQIEIPEGYSLIWVDEFDGSSINSGNWNYETGDGTDYGLPAGWGNNEKQIYSSSSENSSIETDEGASVLAITAREDNPGIYTSAKLTTKNLFNMRFGRVEVRAKLPEGQGIWPAIWTLGDNIDLIDWPGCGEIDIVEVLGHQPSLLNTTVHFTNGDHEIAQIQNVHQLSTGKISDEYHVFTLEWTPESITFGLDGLQIHQVLIEEDMKEFLRSCSLILNVAVGGDWPGDPDETTVFPQTMYIDYVRVFFKDDLEVPDAPPLDIEEETVGPFIEPNIANHAIRDEFTDLGSMTLIAWGGGGEPEISASETAIDGDSSLVFDFPGGFWGGAYIELTEAQNLSHYTYLKFSLNMPGTLADAEIKLESPATDAAIFLQNYTGTTVSDGFVEYSIPLSDFSGLDPANLTIPFAIWNPQDVNQNFVAATVLIDNVHFSN